MMHTGAHYSYSQTILMPSSIPLRCPLLSLMKSKSVLLPARQKLSLYTRLVWIFSVAVSLSRKLSTSNSKPPPTKRGQRRGFSATGWGTDWEVRGMAVGCGAAPGVGAGVVGDMVIQRKDGEIDLRINFVLQGYL